MKAGYALFRRMHSMRPIVIGIVCWLLILWPPLAQAQGQESPDLIVRLRDVDGAGIAGVSVLVLDSGGSHILSRATTDAQGVALVRGILEEEVRIAVEGRLPNGTPLHQIGDDALGVRVFLGAPPTQLDLRSEHDGTVILDPQTMLGLEPAGTLATHTAIPFDPSAPIAAAPPAPDTLRARVQAAPTVPLAPMLAPSAVVVATPVTTAPVTVPGAPVPASGAASPLSWSGWLLLIVLVVAIGAVVLVQARWRSS
jgi:hypothetical protein